VRGLLIRLSELDPGAESAVRVISYFDGLVDAHAGFDALVRSAARLAECAAGLTDSRGRVVARYDANGQPLPREVPEDPLARPYLAGDDSLGRVWLERSDGPGPLDDIVLERMAAAARIAADRAVAWRGVQPDDPMLIEVLLDPGSSEAERAKAARLIGINAATTVRVAVITGAPADAAATPADRARAIFPGHQVIRHTVSNGLLVALLGPGAAASAPTFVLGGQGDIRIGIGGSCPFGVADVSKEQALVALRFTYGVGGPRVVDHARLGPLAALAAIPGAVLHADPAVQAVARLATSPSGGAIIETMEHVCRSSSIRQAAAELHLHHTSVSHRVERIEAELGHSLIDGDDRLRAQVSILMWRLSLSA